MSAVLNFRSILALSQMGQTVYYNVASKRVRVTIVAVEKQ
jgi:hypothetical protein